MELKENLNKPKLKVYKSFDTKEYMNNTAGNNDSSSYNQVHIPSSKSNLLKIKSENIKLRNNLLNKDSEINMLQTQIEQIKNNISHLNNNNSYLNDNNYLNKRTYTSIAKSRNTLARSVPSLNFSSFTNNKKKTNNNETGHYLNRPIYKSGTFNNKNVISNNFEDIKDKINHLNDYKQKYYEIQQELEYLENQKRKINTRNSVSVAKLNMKSSNFADVNNNKDIDNEDNDAHDEIDDYTVNANNEGISQSNNYDNLNFTYVKNRSLSLSKPLEMPKSNITYNDNNNYNNNTNLSNVDYQMTSPNNIDKNYNSSSKIDNMSKIENIKNKLLESSKQKIKNGIKRLNLPKLPKTSTSNNFNNNKTLLVNKNLSVNNASVLTEIREFTNSEMEKTSHMESDKLLSKYVNVNNTNNENNVIEVNELNSNSNLNDDTYNKTNIASKNSNYDSNKNNKLDKSKINLFNNDSNNNINNINTNSINSNTKTNINNNTRKINNIKSSYSNTSLNNTDLDTNAEGNTNINSTSNYKNNNKNTQYKYTTKQTVDTVTYAYNNALVTNNLLANKLKEEENEISSNNKSCLLKTTTNINYSIDYYKKLNFSYREENIKLTKIVKEQNAKLSCINNKYLTLKQNIDVIKKEYEDKIEYMVSSLDKTLTNLGRVQKVVLSQNEIIIKLKQERENNNNTALNLIDLLNKQLNALTCHDSKSIITNGNQNNDNKLDNRGISQDKIEGITRLFGSKLKKGNKGAADSSTNVNSSIKKLKSFVDSLIKKDDHLKKRVEEILQPWKPEEDVSEFEADGFVFNIEKANDKLADFSNPYYTPTGEPETVLEKIDWKNMNFYPKQSSNQIKDDYKDYEQLDEEITRKILQGEGFESLLEDKHINDLIFGGKKKES